MKLADVLTVILMGSLLVFSPLFMAGHVKESLSEPWFVFQFSLCGVIAVLIFIEIRVEKRIALQENRSSD